MSTKEGRTPMQKVADAGLTPMRDRPGVSKGKSLTAESLIDKYGPEEGRRIYHDVAFAGGFGDFRVTASGATPPLDMTGLDEPHNAERKAEVARILAEADAALKPQTEAQGAKE